MEATTLRSCAAAECDKTTDLVRCSRCRLVYYCSKSCQRSHWSAHKPQCVPHKEDTEDVTPVDHKDLPRITLPFTCEPNASQGISLSDAFVQYLVKHVVSKKLALLSQQHLDGEIPKGSIGLLPSLYGLTLDSSTNEFSQTTPDYLSSSELSSKASLLTRIASFGRLRQAGVVVAVVAGTIGVKPLILCRVYGMVEGDKKQQHPEHIRTGVYLEYSDTTVKISHIDTQMPYSDMQIFTPERLKALY